VVAGYDTRAASHYYAIFVACGGNHGMYFCGVFFASVCLFVSARTLQAVAC